MSEDLKEMLTATSVEPGEVIHGTVSSIEDKRVIVQFGQPLEGVVPIRELSALHIEHPAEIVAVGDEVKAKVVKVDEEAGAVILSRRQAEADTAWASLQQKFEQGEALDVVVHDVVKGGLVTDVGVRGFIPASLVDTRFVDDLSELKGKTLRVVISEIDPQNNKLILSRRAVLEQDERDAQRSVIASLEPGSVIEGTVQRIAPFGVFVNVGGVDGLVHVSELAWHHVDNPEEVVHPGDTVRVRVLKVDPDSGRVSLSMKEAQPSPWEQSLANLEAGDVVEGVVRRLVDFGAFVEIRPGVEGLVHVSQISHQRVDKPWDVLEEGQSVRVKVLSVEPERKRISLSIREAEGGQRNSGSRRDVQKFAEKQNQSNAGTGATLGDVFGDLFKRS